MAGSATETSEHKGCAHVGAMDAEEADDVASVGGRSSKASAAWGEVMSLPITWQNVKQRDCCCCGESCLSECPIPDPEDCWDGKRPWRRYIAARNHPGHRMIVANVCLICWEVFKLMGLGLIYGTASVLGLSSAQGES